MDSSSSINTFSKEMRSWIDQDGLIGSCPNPGKWTGGNELLETSFAAVYEVRLLGENADVGFLNDLSNAIGGCRNLDGTFSKNPGRTDQITSDDLKGIACASRICGMPWARAILGWGQRTGWDLSNTGREYWNAESKPWDVALYEMCASYGPPVGLKTMLAGAIAWDAWFGNPSTRRQTWLACCAIKGIDNTVDAAIRMWSKRMMRIYGNVGNMMKSYYNKSDHPYVIWGQSLSF